MDVDEHPFRALAVLVVFLVLGVLTGVGTAWLLVAVHAVGPDNVIAGTALGFSGTMAGLLAGLILLARPYRRL